MLRSISGTRYKAVVQDVLASDRREFLRVNEAHELLEKAVANDSGRPTRKSLLRRISNIPSHVI